MPKCVKCNEFLPPQYTDYIKNAVPDFEGNIPQECVFCKLMVSEVERETEDGSGKYVPYTKADCIKDYKAFVAKYKDMVEKGGIQKPPSQIIT